ncbi:MAG: tRNA (adenosine(37)-N6)-threonylcarbamoyltransferase complex dimerization subunit type 1 TsaB [Lachnospiraceae bacterium]|nr:tRNA (adenosine(37)-N6)-threonylcarbamoyltransferase complex dimerization subunit type 1 TsaB [Lachnospiraceae bacterium]
MRLLSIDSSGLTASVAVTEDDRLIAEYNVNYKKTHSQTLLPMIDEILRMTELDPETLDAVAVSKGPGSFTGLRIGSAAAKGLAQALNIPIIEIPTLLGLACNAFGSDEIICPIMDARRSQVYTALYRCMSKTEDLLNFREWEELKEQCAIGIGELTAELNGRFSETDRILFLGDGVPVFREYLDTNLRVSHSYAPSHMNRQRAAAFAPLAIKYYREGKTVSCFDHAPEYLRLSQAEREKNEGIRQKGAAY